MNGDIYIEQFTQCFDFDLTRKKEEEEEIMKIHIE